MAEKIFSHRLSGKTFDRDRGVKQADPVRYYKLGTKKNPAKVSVQTEERKKELEAIFMEKKWSSIIICDPDKPEDISALEILSNPGQTKINAHNIGRNEPCYCGSGRKFKKCCG